MNSINANSDTTTSNKLVIGNQPNEISSLVNFQINKFKEEVLLKFKDFENQIYMETLEFKKEIIGKSSFTEEAINSHSQRIDYLNSQIAAANNKSDKIVSLEETNKKLNETVFTQNLKITNLEKKISEALYKYDKIYVDSLVIPGLIGQYCKFKTFKEYVEQTDTTVNNLVSTKEKQILDLKSYKDRLEGLIEQLNLQMNKIEKVGKDYTNNKIETVEKMLINDRKETERQLRDNRLENTRHAKELLVATENLKFESSKIEEFKEKVNQDVKEGVANMKKLISESNEEFEEVKGDFTGIKRKFNEIAEFIKDIRFRRNLGVDYQKSDMRRLSTRIVFDSKNKSMNLLEDNINSNVSSRKVKFKSNSQDKSHEKDKEKDDQYSSDVDSKNESYFGKDNNESRLEKADNDLKAKNTNEVQSLLKNYINGKGELPKHKPKSSKRREKETANQMINNEIPTKSKDLDAYYGNVNDLLSKMHINDKEISVTQKVVTNSKQSENLLLNNKLSNTYNFDSKLDNLIDAIQEEQYEETFTEEDINNINHSEIKGKKEGNQTLVMKIAKEKENSNTTNILASNSNYKQQLTKQVPKNSQTTDKKNKAIPKANFNLGNPSNNSGINIQPASIEKVNSISYELGMLKKDFNNKNCIYEKKIEQLENILNQLLSSNGGAIYESFGKVNTSPLPTEGFYSKSNSNTAKNSQHIGLSNIILPDSSNYNKSPILVAESIFNKNVTYNFLDPGYLKGKNNIIHNTNSGNGFGGVNSSYPQISSINSSNKENDKENGNNNSQISKSELKIALSSFPANNQSFTTNNKDKRSALRSASKDKYKNSEPWAQEVQDGPEKELLIKPFSSINQDRIDREKQVSGMKQKTLTSNFKSSNNEISNINFNNNANNTQILPNTKTNIVNLNLAFESRGAKRMFSSSNLPVMKN